jgi:AraC-like DNA-binding protein
MRIQTFIPQNQILSAAIECIYLIEQEENEESESFLILPSVYTYLSISLNTSSRGTDNHISVTASPEKNLDSSVQFGLKSSCIFDYCGKIKEVCVKFKPLGIYNFFAENVLLTSAASDQSFFPNDKYEAEMKRILSCADNHIIISEIENYLLAWYHSFSQPYLSQIVTELESADSEKPVSVEKLALKLGITRQTLNNLCRKYLNLSASEFRQICRFRRFVQAKLDAETNSRLTDFVYDFGFFDQSHLIKEFRKYTFLKPNDFFRKIYHSKDQTILVIWQ